jgi:hypothetical protein
MKTTPLSTTQKAVDFSARHGGKLLIAAGVLTVLAGLAMLAAVNTYKTSTLWTTDQQRTFQAVNMRGISGGAEFVMGLGCIAVVGAVIYGTVKQKQLKDCYMARTILVALIAIAAFTLTYGIVGVCIQNSATAHGHALTSKWGIWVDYIVPNEATLTTYRALSSLVMTIGGGIAGAGLLGHILRRKTVTEQAA